MKLKEVVRGLMIAANEDSEVGRLSCSAVVFVEVLHRAVFRWHGDAGEIVSIAHRLEVAADDEEVYAWPISALACGGHGGVDGVQDAVAAAFDGDAQAM